MRKKGWVLAAAACFLLAGCGESKEALDARLAGIGELENGDASAAIASFETALAEADGVVGEFELDVLKYRAQAEYETGDYAAAAHTFGILAEVDQNRPEYLYHKAASEALAGELETALADYALARESGSGAGVSDAAVRRGRRGAVGNLRGGPGGRRAADGRRFLPAGAGGGICRNGDLQSAGDQPGGRGGV